MASSSDTFRVASLNVHGLKNSLHYLQHLLDCHDLVFVQELGFIHVNLIIYKSYFIVYNKSAMNAKKLVGNI